MMNVLNKVDDVLSWVGDPKGSAIKYISSISSIHIKTSYYKKISIELAEGAVYGINSFSSKTSEIGLIQNKYVKKFFSNNFRTIGNWFKNYTWKIFPKSLTGTIDNVKSLGGATIKNLFSSAWGSTKINKNTGKKTIKGLGVIKKIVSKVKHIKPSTFLKKSSNLLKKLLSHQNIINLLKKYYRG